MVLNSSKYLTNSFTNNNNPTSEKNEEEFNECDVVWSYDDNNNPVYPIKMESIEDKMYAVLPHLRQQNRDLVSHPRTNSTGLSAALEGPPRSPTSIQRKPTSSPAVSVLSSSLTRGSGNISYGKKFHQSAPVNVPIWPNGLGKKRTDGPQFGVGLGCFDDVEMVPPHEIVAKSYSNRMSSSVMEGAGRTLKGRDLTTVRNAVFHKTGFL